MSSGLEQREAEIEAIRLKAVEKWSGVLPQYMIPGSTVPFINLNN